MKDKKKLKKKIKLKNMPHRKKRLRKWSKLGLTKDFKKNNHIYKNYKIPSLKNYKKSEIKKTKELINKLKKLR